MDGATNHLVTPPQTEAAARLSSRESEELECTLHKQRVIDAAQAIDPLKPLRRHPLVTVATAAAFGVVAAAPAAVRTASLLPGGKLLSKGTAIGLARWLAKQMIEHRKRNAVSAAVDDAATSPVP